MHVLHKQIKRNMGNPHFHATWVILTFNLDGSVNPGFRTTESVVWISVQIFAELALANDIEEIPQQVEASVGLCKEHYKALYTSLHPSRNCDFCKVRPHAVSIDTAHPQK